MSGQATQDQGGQFRGHQWAETVAISGQFRGRLRAVFHGRRQWNGSFGDSTEISQDQLRQNARDYLRAGNIVIGHANFPAVTRVYDDIIRLIQARGLTTVTLADVFATTNP